MKKQILRLVTIMVLLSLILTQMTYASSSSNPASNTVFEWKVDKSHLSGDYNSVVYGKGVYVAVGKQGIISTSKDLKKWSTVFKTDNYFGPEPEFGGFKTVLFNGDVFVAAGGRAILYSKDGYNWNKVIIENEYDKPAGFALSYDALINYGMTKGKTFVLTGYGVLAYSADGVHWKNQPGVSIDHGGMVTIGSILTNPIYDGNKLVTISTNWIDENFNKNYSLYTSNDGLDWKKTEIGDMNSHSYDFLAYYEGKYYVSQEYTLDTYESENLTDWTESKEKLDNICYGIDDTIYKLGDGIYSYKEDNGFAAEYQINKTSDNATSSSEPARFKGICKGNGRLVAVGTDGLVLACDTKQKGKWNFPVEQAYKSIYSAAASKNCIIAVGKDGQIIKSKDGQNWCVIKANISQSLNSVIYDGKNFIAVGDKGTIAISETGDSWRIIPQKNEVDLTSIKKINNIYFAVGRHVILTSKNATNWNLVLGEGNDKFFSAEPLSSVALKDGVYYTVSRDNYQPFLYTSKDGTKWEQTSRLKGSYYTDLCFYKGRFVLVGGSTAISTNMKSEMITKEGSLYNDEIYRINVFNDFLLTGTNGGDIYYSPDGIVWSSAGKLDVPTCTNSFVEFKGNIYGFTSNGMIIKGNIRGKIPANSEINVSFLYNYPDTLSNKSSVVTPVNQPVLKGNTLLMTIEAVSKIIGADYSYDKSKKTAEINLGKKNVKFSINSSYITANGKKIKTPQKVYASGNSVYVPAAAAFNSLGYKYSYDSFYRRIYVTIDDTVKNSIISYKQANLGKIEGNIYIQAIGYNKKVFVAVSDSGVIYNSKDGKDWSETTEIKEYSFAKILWNGKRFILTGSTGTNANDIMSVIYVSEDGVKWRKVEDAPAIKSICDGTVGAVGRTAGEAYTGSDLKQTVLVDSEGSVLSSGDGLVWTKTLEGQPWNYSYVCWYKGTYFISGWYSGKVYTSVDGIKWSPYSSKARINRLLCSGDSLWAVEAYEDNNNSSKLYRSANGKDWSYITDIPKKSINEIIYTGRNYVLVGNKSFANSGSESLAYSMVSKDGDLWEYSGADKNMEFVNDILHCDKYILAATGRGIFILSDK